MRNARFGLMAGVVGAAISLLAATSYGQSNNPPATTDPGVSAQTPSTPDANATTSQQPTTPSASANTPATAAPTTTGTDITTGTAGSRTTTTTTDLTTPTTTSTFSFGPVAIVIIALIVIVLLWALLRPRDRAVVRDDYSSATTTRNVGTGPTTERVVSPRAAGGTETTTRTSETDTRL